MTFTERKWRRACVTFTQRLGRGHTGYLCDIYAKKMGQLHSEKEGKRSGSPHRMRVMYKIKGNNKEVYS